ncbi:MAG: hypothetical protein ACRDPF_18550, partial [Streptosporangiaceae bacterium]
MPFTDARSSRPVEDESVPEPGGAAELAGGAGFVPVADGDVGPPGDDRATGVVLAVTPPGEADGASGCPLPPAPRLLPLM